MTSTAVEVPFDLDSQDDVTRAITGQVLAGLEKIHEANEVLLAEDSTSVKEIDDGLKKYEGDNEELKQTFKERVEAEKTFKELVKKTRNMYRVIVLGEDEVSEPDVDIEAVKASRKVILDSLQALHGFATINNNKEVLSWIEGLDVPQVGRQGAARIGQKKARVLVTIDGTVYENFGKAAAALSTSENRITSTDLNQAYMDSGEASEFEFAGKTLKIQPKPSKKDSSSSSDSDSEDENLFSIDDSDEEFDEDSDEKE